MNVRGIKIFAIATLVSSPLLAYGTLSEYVNGNTLRTNIFQNTDTIADPKWNAGAINYELCTGGTVFSTMVSGGKFVASNSSDITTIRNELLSDLEDAIDVWMAGAAGGASISKGTVTLSTTCGPNTGEAFGGNTGASAGKNQIFFNSRFNDGSIMVPDIVGYTVLSMTASSGNLRITDADIILNSADVFTTSGASNAVNFSSRFKFQGVVTHELGHFYGIAHSPITDDKASDDGITNSNENAATMFPAVSSLFQTIALEALIQDDRNAIRFLYNSGSFSGSTYGGTISGTVKRLEGGAAQRGAHVNVYSLENSGAGNAYNSLSGAWTSTTGTLINPDGTYQIKGLPLDTDLIVWVEPASREDIHPNFIYTAFNTPIAVALDSEDEGYQEFAVEAYPDALITDIRATRDHTDSPGIDDAEVIRLTAGSPTRSNVDFFISRYFNPANDPADTSDLSAFNDFDMSITTASDSGSGTLSVSNSAPLQILLTYGEDLAEHLTADTEILVTATSGGTTYNWSSKLPTGTIQSTVTRMTLAAPSVSNGTYTVNATISDSSLRSDLTATRSISVNKWTKSTASMTYDDGEVVATSSGGGGCSAQTGNFPGMHFGLVIFGFFVLFRNRKKLSVSE